MLKLLQKIYRKYADQEWMLKLGDLYRNGLPLGNFLAYKRLKKISERYSNNDILKIIFLVQNRQIWNKVSSIFEAMVYDERFQPLILAIPETDKENDINENYHFFNKKYEGYVINSYENYKWIDLKKLNPNYVFYQRPYDQYLPKQYRSNKVSKYAKLCYVEYGYHMTENTKRLITYKSFLRNIYIYFAENIFFAQENIQRFPISHSKKYRYSVYLGYPVIENFYKAKGKQIELPDKYFKILWTPRWSEDKASGGSNFLKYKEKILKFVEENKDIYLLFRPHPLTFKHFVSIGKMSHSEAENYIDIVKHGERSLYDESSDYAKVFWATDMLLTDMSGIIVEYYITGKPIIYCDTGFVEPNINFKKLLEGIYIVNNWEEATEKMIELSHGIDPLKDKRQEIIKELFGDKLDNISNNFIEYIYADNNPNM